MSSYRFTLLHNIVMLIVIRNFVGHSFINWRVCILSNHFTQLSWQAQILISYISS
nr:MAG TPA: hypothetical protein [Caudoviricetes sp.]